MRSHTETNACLYSSRTSLIKLRFMLTAAATVVIGAAYPATGSAQSFFEADSAARQRPALRKSVRPVRASVARPLTERPAAPSRRSPADKSATAREPALKPIPAARADQSLQPPEPLVAVISLASQRMVVYGSQGVVTDTKVSTGQAGHRTPTGVFSVLQRNRYHHSNIYSGAPMPFMQRLTWSGIALHQGVVPGYPASHGCVRMPADFAPRMWGLGRIGMRVLIAPGDVTPAAIEHARLPVPAMTAVPGSDIVTPTLQTASIGTAPPAAQSTTIAPYPLAHYRRAKAIANQMAVEREIKGAQELVQERSADANRAGEVLRAIERDVGAAEADLAVKNEVVARLQSAAAEAPEALAVVAATTNLERLRRDLAVAKAEEHRASDLAFDAAKALKALQQRADEVAVDVRHAAASLEPVSIFVSRKEGMVYVRQGFTPLHEEPISFAVPEQPLGTHVFTAIEGRDGGAALRWQVVTLPSNPPAQGTSEAGRKRAAAPQPPLPTMPASTAAGALDRFELPAETVKFIADRLWSGATLIVSDYGISGETGRGTDFVVLTH